jgi:type VI secretion system secreted protein Hcp
MRRLIACGCVRLSVLAATALDSGSFASNDPRTLSHLFQNEVSMAMNAFLRVQGLRGSARQKHTLDRSNVWAFEHDIESERNPETGEPAGRRRHRLFTVTKEIDAMSPGLHDLHAKGKVIGSVGLEFWRMPPAGGDEEGYYEMVLSNAKVARVRTFMLNNRIQEQSLIPEYEEVSFTYEGISFNYKPGKDAVGKTTSSEVPCNPAPDKQEEMARNAVVGGAQELSKRIAHQLGQVMEKRIGDMPIPIPPPVPE